MRLKSAESADFLTPVALEREGSSITQSYMIPDLILDLESDFVMKIIKKSKDITQYHRKSHGNHDIITLKS